MFSKIVTQSSKIIFSIASLSLIFFFTIYFLPQYLKIETRGYEAFQFMDKNGIIENVEAWKIITKQTHNGRNITNITQLNEMYNVANRHSSASELVSVKDQVTMETLPSCSEIDEFTVITIPGIYSNDNRFVQTYVNTLSQFIQKSSGKLVLDLTNNSGGSREPMIIGASSLIPDGNIFNEIDKERNSFPLLLENNTLIGGIPGTLWPDFNKLDFLSVSKKLEKKVAVLTNNKTASAAENLLLALKNNKNVRVFGEATAGLTSLNKIIGLPSSIKNNFWLLSCTIGYIETDSRDKNEGFIHRKIEPDIHTKFTFMSRSNQELFDELREWFNEPLL